MSTTTAPKHQTTVLHVGGLHYATQKSVVEHVLGNRPSVLAGSSVIVALNAVALKRLRLPDQPGGEQSAPASGTGAARQHAPSTADAASSPPMEPTR